MDNTGAAPLVSCIITTYKREFPMIQAAIDSIRAQTYPAIEWIVVSDNPPDSEYARAVAAGMKEYPDGMLIQLEKNSGAQVARNRGLLACKGEFVACLDDDDLWAPEKIEREMALFTDDSVGVAFCSGYTFTGSIDNVIALYRPPNAYKEWPAFQDMLYTDYVGSTSNPIIRRSVFAKVGLFDTDLKARQDYEMWIRVSRAYKLHGTLDRLFYHRMHEGEQISKSPEVSIRSNLQVFEKYKKDYRKHREAAVGLLFRVSLICARSGKHGQALTLRLRCIAYHPVRWAKLRLRYACPKLYYKLTGEKDPRVNHVD